MSYNKLEYQSTTITGVSQNQIFTGRGTLHSIIVGSTSVAALKIGDATSGTSSTVGILKASVTEGNFLYDAVIANGLRVTLDGTAASPGSYTIMWVKG